MKNTNLKPASALILTAFQMACMPLRAEPQASNIALQQHHQDESTSGALFNGKDLTGWTALPGGHWEVKDGVIVGTSPASEQRHGILLSEKQYTDFEITIEYKALSGNSGFYFRAERVAHALAVAGFQAEIDARGSDAGGLYETLGRKWVVKPSAKHKAFKPGQWNTMNVRAVGRHIVVHLNGMKTAELKDDPGRLEGHFGLQLHGGQKTDVAFRNIQIKELKQTLNHK